MQKSETYWELFWQTGLCEAYLCYAEAVQNVFENQGAGTTRNSL